MPPKCCLTEKLHQTHPIWQNTLSQDGASVTQSVTAQAQRSDPEDPHQYGHWEFRSICAGFLYSCTWKGIAATYGWLWVSSRHRPISFHHKAARLRIKEILLSTTKDINQIDKQLTQSGNPVTGPTNLVSLAWPLKTYDSETSAKCTHQRSKLREGWRLYWGKTMRRSLRQVWRWKTPRNGSRDWNHWMEKSETASYMKTQEYQTSHGWTSKSSVFLQVSEQFAHI